MGLSENISTISESNQAILVTQTKGRNRSDELNRITPNLNAVIGSFTRLSLLITVGVSFIVFVDIANAQQRYGAPNINAQAGSFLARADQSLINVDFIVAHTVNRVFHAVREGREVAGAAIIDGSETAAGSVVIGPGNDVGDLIIINENEGDSIVVNRR